MSKMNSAGIYVITNAVNGKVYVGSAVNIPGRWRVHKSDLRRGVHHSSHLQAAWNKYGDAAFTFSVLELVFNPADILQAEDKWIARLGATARDKGYNICLRAGSQLGLKHSAEARQKMSAAGKGRAQQSSGKTRLASMSSQYCNPAGRRRLVGASNSAFLPV